MEADRKKQVMAMKIRVTSENYRQEIEESDIPVLVEFFADWCGKCAMMEDTVDLAAANCGGSFKVCQIEIEDSADLAEKFQVEIVPTFVVFRNGEPVSAAAGVLNREVVLDMIREEIGLEISG